MNYTPEDELLIEEKYEDLMASCEKIYRKETDRDFIKKAFFLAKEAHKGVRRRSGEPYLLHPIAVAKIAVDEIGLGVKSVVAALLHDVVEDTEYTVEDITNMFGQKIATMVDGLTKMSGVFNTETSEQAENFRNDTLFVKLVSFAAAAVKPKIVDFSVVGKQLANLIDEIIVVFLCVFK